MFSDKSINVLGLKAFAMSYFKECGLFEPELIVFPPMNCIELIERIENLSFNGDITIRFSHKCDLGLPRFFSRDKSGLVSKVRDVYDPAWATIIHPYLDVRRSFELNLMASSWWLEHVPGVWESENTLRPDMLNRRSNNTYESKIFLHDRLAKIQNLSAEFERVVYGPVDRRRVLSWSRRVERVYAKIKSDMYKNFPINVHFVENNRGEWYFLNMRSGFSQSTSPVSASDGAGLRVSCEDDLLKWDGVSPIIIGLQVERGDEASLFGIVEKIKSITSTVYVDFGILSHPAIVMREYGLQVLPSHRLANYEGGRGYDTYEFS